jgi:hypothetical protein
MYRMLREYTLWIKWLPDSQAVGTTAFTLDLVNSWSGSELQSMLVWVSREVPRLLELERR